MTILPVRVDSIPALMRAERRWMLWRVEVRDGRTTKVPYRATAPNLRASSTDPATWSDYPTALSAYEDGKADGIGFALGEGWFGLDRDHCVHDGEIDAEGRAMLEAIGTYAELSVSGTGLHVIGRGALPPGPRRRGQIEAYDSGRYFTVSGHRIPGTPANVTECTAALTAWYARTFAGPAGNGNGHRPTPCAPVADDAEILARARHARNGLKFSALFDAGDWNGYPSQSEADSALCMMLAFWTGRDEARIDRLFRLSGLFRAKWDERHGDQTYGERTIAAAVARCSEVYEGRAGRVEVHAGPEYEDPPYDPDPARQTQLVDVLSEAGAAERFARLHGNDVRYDHRRGRWLMWDRRWRPDADAAITRLFLRFVREWQRSANEIEDTDRRQKVFTFACKLEARSKVESVLALARCLKPIADTGQEWDADPWLLCTPGGRVIDFRAGGAVRPARRDDRITLCTGVEYDPEATSELWESALRSILVTDETIAFLQLAAGYSATGDTRRDCWFLLNGSGRNGKGTVIHPIRRALGDYAGELPAAVFDVRRESAPYDLATLPGKRLVTSSESGDTIRINHDRIKQITGGDPIRAANKFERSFEFQPTCKLWLSANRRPRVTDDSPAFWARVMLVPFSVSFAGREDRDLRPALEQEPDHQAAILAWIVRGALRYVRHGLEPPRDVTAATLAYEEECDPLADFLEDACELEPQARIGAADLYGAYKEWADRQHFSERERLTSTAFGRRVSGRFKSEHGRSGRLYFGVRRRGL